MLQERGRLRGEMSVAEEGDECLCLGEGSGGDWAAAGSVWPHGWSGGTWVWGQPQCMLLCIWLVLGM